MVKILLSFISVVGWRKEFPMCEIGSVLRLAGFIEHHLPEFLFLLALEGINKKTKLPTYRSNPHPTVQQDMALEQEAAEPGLITRE